MDFIVESAIKLAFAMFIVLTSLAYLVLVERKILGWIQLRVGPNRTGPWGLLQPLADLLKFLLKEDLRPDTPDKWLFLLAPAISLIPAIMTIALIPFGGTAHLFGREIGLYVTSVNVGLLLVFALGSIGVYGIVLGGWASNNKYSLLGGLRAAAQMLSYELSLTLSVVGVLIQSGTLDLQGIVQAQTGTWWNVVPRWHIFWFQPLGFLLYFISAIAETNRVPFDLPEAETELVAGYHTEYSSIRFAMYFVAEYANMFTVAALATTLFLGGWTGPGAGRVPLLGVGYFALKMAFFLFLYIWVRGTLPRFRYDQLMDFGWKFLLPLSLANIIFSAALAAWN